MSENAIQSTSAFNSSEGFELLQRVGNMFAKSELVPAHLRGKPADCIIAVQLAHEMGLAPLSVLQNIYMVSGKAGWSAQFLIARANASGVFDDSGIDWEVTGKGADLEVTAFATKRAGGRRVEYTVTLAMAKAEGWTKNAKYSTMPELMLRYRAATTLIGLYCPEVKFGLGVREELEDMAVSAPPAQVSRIKDRVLAAAKHHDAEVVEEPLAVDPKTELLVSCRRDLAEGADVSYVVTKLEQSGMFTADAAAKTAAELKESVDSEP